MIFGLEADEPQESVSETVVVDALKDITAEVFLGAAVRGVPRKTERLEPENHPEIKKENHLPNSKP